MDPSCDRIFLTILLNDLKVEVERARTDAERYSDPQVVDYNKALAEERKDTALALWRLMDSQGFEGIGPIPE